MTDPASPDDDWNDLARELGVDKSAPPVHAAPPPDMVERHIEAEAVEPHHGPDERLEEEAVAEGDEAEAIAEEEFGDEEGAPGETAEALAEGQSGTGRKRRRRRRRRRKGNGAPAEEAAPLETAPGEIAEEEEGGPAEEPADEGEDFGVEEVESEVAPLTFEEDTAGEVLRDLIANWNVPSWDDIVGGLYRPG